MTADETRARRNLITRLAIATREKIVKETVDVYVDGTAGIRLVTLDRVCHELERTSKWFPPVAEIVERCVGRERVEAGQRDTQKRLNAEPPVSEERQRELWQRLRHIVRTHSFPGQRTKAS
jgi:hypothetical protein